jgi:hypothetical protein
MTKKKTTTKTTARKLLTARYSRRQNILVFWVSPDRWGYTYNIEDRDAAKELISDSGITQELTDVNWIE